MVLIGLIAAAVFGLFSITRQIQMLQQNSYFPSRYSGWIYDAYVVPLALDSILFCFSGLLYGIGRYFLLFLMMIIILIIKIPLAIRAQKKSIKKLVFTARVKRLYGAAFLLFAGLILTYILFPGQFAGEIGMQFLFLLALVPPVTVYLCWLITAPLEKWVASLYIKSAKRILKEKSGLMVIGITGSYGKTGTKFILQRILSEKYNVVATPQSFNTPMGVVRTVREHLRPETQVFVCEMGAKNIGDIKEICDIVHPDYGLITSVGAQHLETFKTVDNVFKTKFELAQAVTKKGGEVFVNGDSGGIADRINPADYKVYGAEQNGNDYAENITYGADGTSFTLVLDGERVAVSTRLLGLHNVINIVGAAAVAHTLGVSGEDIRFAVSALAPAEHRLELKSFKNGSLLIDDAYNANPEGCIEAVRVLGRFDGFKKVIVTPGLIELGVREYDCNYALGAEAAKICDTIILVGKKRSEPLQDGVKAAGFDEEQLHVVSSFAEAMEIYAKIAARDVVVLFENDLPDNYLK